MNSCFVSFMCLVSYCFSISFFYCFFTCICICFGGPIRCLKIAGVSYRRQDICGILWGFPVKSPWRIAARSALARPARTVSPKRRQVQPLRQRHLRTILVLGTNTLVLKIFSTFFLFFSIVDLTEKVHRSLHFSVFSIW